MAHPGACLEDECSISYLVLKYNGGQETAITESLVRRLSLAAVVED